MTPFQLENYMGTQKNKFKIQSNKYSANKKVIEGSN